jgi:hypothetical protein
MYAPRYRSTFTLVVVLAAAGLTVPAEGARGSFSGNVCSMLTAKQVTTVHAPSKCKPTTLQGPGFTSSNGTWGTVTATGPHLSVTVNAYQSTGSAYFQIAKKVMNKLPGQAKKVSGIGSLAYESGADGSTLAAINFILGKDIVDINLRAVQPPTSLAALNALAKAIAAQL